MYTYPSIHALHAMIIVLHIMMKGWTDWRTDNLQCSSSGVRWQSDPDRSLTAEVSAELEAVGGAAVQKRGMTAG